MAVRDIITTTRPALFKEAWKDNLVHYTVRDKAVLQTWWLAMIPFPRENLCVTFILRYQSSRLCCVQPIFSVVSSSS